VNLNGKHLTVNAVGFDDSLVLNGLVNGNGQINKDGLGSLIISGNTDSPTALFEGSLVVLGTVGHVSFQDGTLAGTGTTEPVSIGCTFCKGNIAPGNGLNQVGTLTTNGFVSLNAASSLSIDLRGPTQSDLYQVNGNVMLNGANLSLTLGFVPTIGQQFTIVSQNGLGDIYGQFAQGSGIVVNSQLFSITYTQSSIVLTALGPLP
jgi:hypothetical protein